MIFRQYQKRTINKMVSALKEHGNSLAIAPTGAGKTIMLSGVAGNMQPAKTLVLQHRDELVAQNLTKFRKVNPQISVGMFTADHKSWNGSVTFGMAQTLCRQKNLDTIPSLDLLIVDEAHHCAAESYKNIIGKIRDKNPRCMIAGFTATPNRGDKKGLRSIFDNCADQITIKELINLGFLVPPIAYVIEINGVEEGLSKVRKTRDDYDMAEVEAVMNLKVINEEVVERWREKAGDRKTIIFCSTVKHAEDVTRAFREAGVSADMVTGETPSSARAATLKRFDRGDLQVLVNVAVLTEGFDSPPASCIILLRPCSYKSTMIQMIGRGLRTVNPEEYPGVVKKDCIAEGTMILTNKGLVEISKITNDSLLWDGVEWVKHDGVIFKGEQEVIEYEGLLATPDHKVWTASGWMRFDECKRRSIPIAVTGRYGQTIRKAENYFTRGSEIWTEEKKDPSRSLFGLWGNIISRLQQCYVEQGWMSPMWESASSSEMVSSKVLPGKRQMHKQEESTLSRLWRKGDRVQIQLSYGHGGLDCQKSWDRQIKTNRSDKQQRTLRNWKYSIGIGFRKSIEYSLKKIQCLYAQIQGGLSRGEICGFNDHVPVLERINPSGDREEVFHCSIEKTKRRVWDILNAGPRNRFTANGLLVSNCIVLDFGTSLKTHGDIHTSVDLNGNDGKEPGEAPEKKCPECEANLPLGVRECPLCGYIFESSKDEDITIEDVTLTEMDVINNSPFRWVDLFGSGKIMIASGFNAFAGVFSMDGDNWHAMGKVKESKILRRLLVGDKIRAISAADDFLRENESDNAAHKSKSWLKLPPTEKQIAALARVGYQNIQFDFSITRYSAAAHLSFQWNRDLIERALFHGN